MLNSSSRTLPSSSTGATSNPHLSSSKMSSTGVKLPEAQAESGEWGETRRGLNCLFVSCAIVLAIASFLLCALWASVNAPGEPESGEFVFECKIF